MTNEEYDQAASFWIKKDQEGKALDRDTLKQEVITFLKEHKILALATAGKEVRATPLEYSYKDGALYIFSEGGEKFANLKVNKQVAAAIFDANGAFGSLKSLQIKGTASMVDLFSDEYNEAALQRKIPLEALKKLPEPMWLIKIVPDEIVELNSSFKKKGYNSRQTLKINN